MPGADGRTHGGAGSAKACARKIVRMTVAAVHPYSVGYCGVVIASGDAPPFQVVATESLPVGHLTTDGPIARGKNARRECSDGEAAALAQTVMRQCVSAGVTRIFVEAGASVVGGSVSRWVQSLAASNGIRCDVMPASPTGPRRRLNMHGLFIGWPAQSYTSIEGAAELLVAGMSGEVPSIEGALDLPSLDGMNADQDAAATTFFPEAPSAAPQAQEVPAEPPTTIQFTGPCRAGIDPGSRWVAIAIADATGTVVAWRSFEVGHDRPLVKPKTIKRKDGTTYQRAVEHVITSDDIDDLIAKIDELLRAFGVNRAVVEWIEHARVPVNNPAVAIARATEIARAQWVGGEICRWCKALALVDTVIDVETVVYKQWAGPISRASTTKDIRDKIRPAVLQACPQMTAADEHELDAAGIVLWDMMPAKTEPAVTERRHVRAPEGSYDRAAAKRESMRALAERNRARKLADRAARGCSCGLNSNHRKTCPLYVPRKYKAQMGLPFGSNEE